MSNSTSVAGAERKPRLGQFAIANLSFGFFGIQIAFALQQANVSRIFQTLGASIDGLPILWSAGPITGLLVQPIVGYFSDRTWGRLGRRRPYFLGGAVASAAALAFMPNAPVLWIAVVGFWILDVSLNVSMEPFRAFVGDMLSEEQRTTGYSVQTIFIGIGAVLASAAPYFLRHYAGVSSAAAAGAQADSVRWAFYIGAAALFAAVMWTVVSTREYSPAQLARFAGRPASAQAPPQPWTHAARELLDDLLTMSPVMRRLAVVQFFSWSGLFVMWIFGTPVVAQHQFGGATPGTQAYEDAAEWVGVLLMIYNGVAAAYAFVLPWLARRLGRGRTHALNLVIGGLGLAGFWMTRDHRLLILAMVGIGIGWASILTMPYAILCEAIPFGKFGAYMGLFNFFIVLPQLVVAGTTGALVRHFFPGDPAGIMFVGGACLWVAAYISWRRLDA
jgi:maltose/moltooligosaccharide transporter